MPRRPVCRRFGVVQDTDDPMTYWIVLEELDHDEVPHPRTPGRMLQGVRVRVRGNGDYPGVYEAILREEPYRYVSRWWLVWED